MLADPVLLNKEALADVPATLIGISVKVLLDGVITPSIMAPRTMAPLTTDPIVIGWLIPPTSSTVCFPVVGSRSIPAMA